MSMRTLPCHVTLRVRCGLSHAYDFGKLPENVFRRLDEAYVCRNQYRGNATVILVPLTTFDGFVVCVIFGSCLM